MTEHEVLQELDIFIDANKRAMVDDLAALIAVNSVHAPAAGAGAPFGADVRKALDVALGIAARLGLETNDRDGYVGWAQLAGVSEKHIATITHVDIVPPGEGWNSDALTLREKDGWLIGRGVIDDKGPTILGLYAAAFLAQLGLPLRYGLRVLMGTDEETSMKDVDYYFANNPQPVFCFSPDAQFPLANGEKGILQGDIVSQKIYGNIITFTGGLASNAVCENAGCTISTKESNLPNTPRIDVSYPKPGMAALSAKGISAHAANPQNGVSAIGLLVDYLLENKLCADGAEHDFIELLQKLHSHTNGKGLGIACTDDSFGGLTCIGGLVSLEDGVITQNINIRYPTATTGGILQESINKLASATNAEFDVKFDMKPFYVSPDDACVQALISAYETITGRKDAKPFTIGGGTYARHFEKAVSFGPCEKDEIYPNFANREHAPNEGMRIESFFAALRIYVLAIIKLQSC